jgi:hypothetical protein
LNSIVSQGAVFRELALGGFLQDQRVVDDLITGSNAADGREDVDDGRRMVPIGAEATEAISEPRETPPSASGVRAGTVP